MVPSGCCVVPGVSADQACKPSTEFRKHFLLQMICRRLQCALGNIYFRLHPKQAAAQPYNIRCSVLHLDILHEGSQTPLASGTDNDVLVSLL